jgi:hypothetical protein
MTGNSEFGIRNSEFRSFPQPTHLPDVAAGGNSKSEIRNPKSRNGGAG